ncbi:MAG: DUF6804 family protein [Bacteroidota bacterium]|jgi:hypothetical protein
MWMEQVLKIIVAILLFVCLLEMPYGYYQFVRLIATIAFLFFAVKSNGRKDEFFFPIYCAFAILFQPFFKISLTRELWNIADMIIGAILVFSTFKKEQK